MIKITEVESFITEYDSLNQRLEAMKFDFSLYLLKEKDFRFIKLDLQKMRNQVYGRKPKND